MNVLLHLQYNLLTQNTQSMTNLPWYVYLMIGIMIISFMLQKGLPFLKDAKRVMSNDAYIKNPNGSSISNEQKKALAVGAINGEQTSCYVDTLETGMEDRRLNKGLNEYWGVYNSDTALSTLEWLKNDGHRIFFDKIYSILTTEDQANWKNSVNDYFGEESDKAYDFLKKLSDTVEELKGEDNIPESSFQKGILAWDMGRMVVVARMCYDKKFIDKETAWNYINHALTNSKGQFNSWKELGDSYIIGRAMWSGNDMMLPGLKGIAQDLLTKEESPWKKIQF